MIVLLDQMRASRKSPQVALTKYNVMRGKNPYTLIFVFEGEDDFPYYETIVKRIRSDIYFSPLIANGKDQVLGLRKLILRQKTKDKKICFFVDKDYDGPKNEETGEDLYISEGYSIENHLVSESTLRSLLKSEYKCHLPEDEEDIEYIVGKFYDLLNMFFNEMFEANLAIYHARQQKIELKSIDNKISRYISINIDKVEKTENCHFELIGWPEDRNKDIEISKDNFCMLDPHMEWRGKYIYDFFIKILKILKDDRTSNQPHIFSKKRGMKYDPNNEVTRSLTALSDAPKSLIYFLKSIPE